jgi:hypothetical protein
MSIRRLIVLVPLCVLATASAVPAQTNVQVWGDLSLNWTRTGPASWAMDLEPQALLASSEDEPGWWSFGVTPNFEYAAKNWLDVITEVRTVYSRQTDALNSFELTPRAGFRLHLFSRDVPNRVDRYITPGERPPKRRLVLRDRLLIEERNLFYSQDQPTTSTWRVRNRVEFQFALNRDKATDAGARTILADYEAFLPLGTADERFSNRHRIRSGLGFRQSFAWRAELVYVWTRSRNTLDEPFSTSDNAISFTVQRFFK